MPCPESSPVKRLVFAIAAVALLIATLVVMAACLPMQERDLAPTPPPSGASSAGEYWALIIGIDNYHSALPLQTAVRDAMEVRDDLSQRFRVRRERLIELFNEQATRQNIANALFRLRDEATPDDIVLIYFAGHAQYDMDGRLQWWLPVEGTPQAPETLLTDAAIQQELRGRKAKEVHLFHVMAGVAQELHLAQSNLQPEHEALEQTHRQAEEHAQPEAASRQEEEASRLAAEEARRAAEEQARREPEEAARREAEKRAHLDAEQLAREQEERANLDVERRKLEAERQRLEEARTKLEAERQALQEAQRLARELEQAKARAEQRSQPIEEARVRPFTPPSPPPAGRELIGKDGAPMVLVPAGEFTMGGESIDNPRHPVYLDAFYMDKYEVTTSRYARFLQATRRQLPFKWSEVGLVSHGDRPVIGVIWEDANAYCRWVGKRLPTEAEWEKAARGTDGREYPWGNEAPTPRHANFNKCCEWKGYGVLAIVGSLEAGRSPYGIYDLAGNVSEWVADWYDMTSYKYELDRNPKGPANGEEKVVRGGSWYDPGSLQRSALRSRNYPSAPSTDRGFRCAKDAKP
jgi:formylglycine-generating enzyme required for sulfatase activity